MERCRKGIMWEKRYENADAFVIYPNNQKKFIRMKKLMTNARTTEVDDTSDRLLVLYNDEPALAEEAFLKPLFGEMQTLSDQITEAIKRDRILS